MAHPNRDNLCLFSCSWDGRMTARLRACFSLSGVCIYLCLGAFSHSISTSFWEGVRSMCSLVIVTGSLLNWSSHGDGGMAFPAAGEAPVKPFLVHGRLPWTAWSSTTGWKNGEGMLPASGTGWALQWAARNLVLSFPACFPILEFSYLAVGVFLSWSFAYLAVLLGCLEWK